MGKKGFTDVAKGKTAFVNQALWFTSAAIQIAAFVNQALWFTSAVIQIAAFVNQVFWFTNAAIQITVFINQNNFKNATAFFTKADSTKATLNKAYFFFFFALLYKLFKYESKRKKGGFWTSQCATATSLGEKFPEMWALKALLSAAT